MRQLLRDLGIGSNRLRPLTSAVAQRPVSDYRTDAGQKFSGA
jgi:hypothetical protein